MDVRSNLINTYNARKHEVEATCAILNQSDDFDKQIWANILKSAFNPDHLFLFSNGKEILLVWGIKTNKQLDYLVPFDAYKSSLLPATIEEISANETDELNSTDINNDGGAENEVSEENRENQEEESVAMPPDFTDSPEIDAETSDPNSSEEKLSEQTTLPPDDIEKPPSPSKKKHWFYLSLDRFEIFAGKYWWLILIVLIILLWLLLDKCNKPVEQPRLSDDQVEEIYDEIMPEIPQKRIIPIDTSDFREDDNTGNIIVAGLLNIAIVENKAVFKRMAVELKQHIKSYIMTKKQVGFN